MTRLESVAWTLAGGGATIFVLSAALKGQPWLVALVTIMVAVGAWSWRAPLAGMALGVIGWLCLTGFDVNSAGELRVSGRVDVIRLAVLVGIVPAVALIRLGVGALDRLAAEARPLSRRPDETYEPEALIWASPHRLMDDKPLGAHESSGVSDGDRFSRPAVVTTPHKRPRSRGTRTGTAR